MQSIKFPGSRFNGEIWTHAGKTPHDGKDYCIIAFQPNEADLQAINNGGPVYMRVKAALLPPIRLFTLNEKNEPNDY